MNHICIGIHLHAEPERLLATLTSLRTNTAQPVDILLLPDGPDEATNVTLATLRDLPQWGTADALGTPACFNRLAQASEAEVLVLLESGTQVGPDWLGHLLAALNADPRNGLAGPSTNMAWNEQGVFPYCGDTIADVARTAEEAALRFGSTIRTLEPLYSLADFCYAVRREVVQTIGAADEEYGLGPCWEMDYNIRAARADFRGVWACAAYVHRAPFTGRRRHEESLRFEANKYRYQDKFCALRLRRERTDYEPHCQGEECEHFAPPTLIQVQMPLPKATSAVAPKPVVTPLETAPMISCIMPACGRTDFVLQSILYFQRQTYPSRELIIMDDGGEDLTGKLPDDPRIRYLRLPPGLSIGAKRNKACELAHGSIIAHWDDDDWYSPDRLGTQIAPLLSGEADICGLTAGLFFDLTRWEFWGCTEDLHRRLFVADVHGGTLVYHRRIWEQIVRYPDQSLAEDAAFLHQALRSGTRLCKLPGDRLFIYLRHAGNSWSFACGQYLDPKGWRRMLEPLLPPIDREFYAAHSPIMAIGSQNTQPHQLAQVQPLVSCIMPTADRRPFAAQAIQYFLRQDYPNRELIVVDDGIDGIADLIPPDLRIRYLRLEGKHTIGAKRNLACKSARGEIVAHWDDDDWMASWRLSYQVANLLRQQADICGLDKLLFYDPASNQSWQYIYFKGCKPWVAGSTLCYAKSVWSQNLFPEIDAGEDNCFLWSSRSKNILALQDTTFYVAVMHPGNTSPKQTQDAGWHSYSNEKIREVMGDDWKLYTDLLRDQKSGSP